MRNGILITGFLTLALSPVYAVTIGQTDDFEDGTTMGWHVGAGGHPAPPANVDTGGPAGAGDAFLQLTALGGSGSGSKLAAFNTAQWMGDYITAGITHITMSVNNLGSADDLDLRLLFINFAGGPPANIAITDAVHLPVGSGWQNVSFDIRPAALTVLLGTAQGALSNVEELRIFHNPDADYPLPPNGPPAVTALVGVDNIQAAPEPASILLMTSGFAALLWRRSVRRRI